MSRRKLLGVASAGLVALALAACAGPSVAGTDPEPTASTGVAGPDFTGVEPADKITFLSANPGGSQAVTQEIIDAFTAETGIEVELQSATSYEETAQKFQAAQAGGGLPDLLTLSDVWWFRFYMNEQIIPLDSALEAAGISADDYVPGFYADYTYDGAQWGVPFARSTPLFYYNKAHWEAAGLPDRAPETWAEFAEWAPKLQAATGVHAYGYPETAGYAGWTLQNLLWGYGTGWSAEDSFDVTANSPEAVEALTFMQDSIYEAGWATQAATSAQTDLVSGAISATILSTGSLVGTQTALESAGNPFELGVGFLPGGPVESDRVVPTGGTGVSITAGVPVENQLAAAMFIKFLTNPENSIKFSAATGYIPVNANADTSALTGPNPLAQTAIDQLARIRPQDYARVFLPGADGEMALAVTAINTTQADVQSTLDQLAATIEGIYTSQVEPNL